MPFLSVVIPLYNKEKDIESTLKSVFDQTFKDFEIVVVNDGSTDNSLALVEKIKDPRLKIYSISNGGLSYARNYGVKQASGEHIAFLDADDIWYANHLSTLKCLIDKFPNNGWYGTSYKIIHKNKKELPSLLFKNWSEGWQGLITNFFLINRTQWLIHICSICVKKTFFYEIGAFDERLTSEEDIDFYIRIALRFPIAYANVITLRYNMLGSNRISDSSFKDKISIDFGKYRSIEDEREDLKKFLDFFRYTQYVKFRITSNYLKAKEVRDGIHLENLTLMQRVLIRMPKFVLIFGKGVKNLLLSFNVNLQVTGIKRN
ncbi:MAG: glycosyltransferase family 2 protein [Marinilabiliaceae bacterium]|nr:glycosyltransferase family 2 protein [Marinilabiliaceae bacterium]